MKVLVVEDEAKLAAALSKGLKHKGFTVDTIADGKEAYTRITLYKDDYDIVILDLMLPSMDGYAICKGVREKGVNLPILVLTARDEVDLKVELLLSGADDYLAKPFSFEELHARIQALLRRPTETVAKVLSVGDITLDPVERRVLRNDEEVGLTLKEFALLEYFMRHPNQVINREELLNHLWDFNYASFFSNVLDVHVKNLRKKLDDKEAHVLETVRGIGYRLRG